jgi:N-acetyl-gamma-glutamyl-phosphate reductase
MPERDRTTPHIFIAGGKFDETGGRPSGYIRKLAEALEAALPHVRFTVVNGGSYVELENCAKTLLAPSAILWFADVPNELPKLLPSLKKRFCGAMLVQSKNNRRGAYTRVQLRERMATSGATLLLEFTNATDGILLCSILRHDGSTVLDRESNIGAVASHLAATLPTFSVATTGPKRVCVIGARGTVSTMLQAQLRALADVTVLATDTARSLLMEVDASIITSADLVVLATDGFASPDIFARLPRSLRVLDISPSFREDPFWEYGLPELSGTGAHIAAAPRVANPGCFATSAILMLAPLIRQGLLDPSTALYLDAVGGYTTGGARMIEQAERGELTAESVFSLVKEHRHVSEIRAHAGVPAETPVWFTPKVGNFARGIRMQIPLFGCSKEAVLDAFRKTYVSSFIQVADEVPPRLAGDTWANRRGAKLFAQDMPGGTLALCVMDNLGKGAVDSAFENIRLMLCR